MVKLSTSGRTREQGTRQAPSMNDQQQMYKVSWTDRSFIPSFSSRSNGSWNDRGNVSPSLTFHFLYVELPMEKRPAFLNSDRTHSLTYILPRAGGDQPGHPPAVRADGKEG